jgi:hypothetical protein
LLHFIQERLAVTAGVVLFGYLGVTIGTVGPACFFARAMQARIDVGVTLYAGNVAVYRVRQHVFVDGHRKRVRAGHFVDVCFLVTLQTIPVGNKQRQGLFAYFVGPMTVRASGYRSGLALPKLPADNLYVYLFDSQVAAHTSSRDIIAGNRRIRVGVRENLVAAVTIGTGGGNQKTFFEHTLAVNTLAVVFYDIVFRNIVSAGDRSPFTVASAA